MRHKIHKNAEESLKEFKTKKSILNYLKKFEDIKIWECGKTSLIVDIKGKKNKNKNLKIKIKKK